MRRNTKKVFRIHQVVVNQICCELGSLQNTDEHCVGRIHPFEIIEAWLNVFIEIACLHVNMRQTLVRPRPLEIEKQTLKHRIKQFTHSISSGIAILMTVDACKAFRLPSHCISCIVVFF